MAVHRIVIRNEFLQILEAQRLLFQRVVNIGAVIKKPDFLRPRLFTCRMVVKEQHVRFHAVGVEDAGAGAIWCADRWFPAVSSHRLARAPLKQHIVRHD